MNHTLIGTQKGKLGVWCSCGFHKPVERDVLKHIDDENGKQEAASGAIESSEKDKNIVQQTASDETITDPEPDSDTPEQYRNAEKGIQRSTTDKTDTVTGEITGGAAIADTQAEVKTQPPQKTGRQEIAVADDKGEKQVEFSQLSPFDQSRLQVQKYVTELVGGKWGKEFMFNLTTIARDDPRIAKSTPESIVKSLKACIDARLMPNTFAQHAMVAPYWNSKKNTYELQFQLMKNGLIELARRTGQVRTINVELVYEGDEFDVEYGTERYLHHKPNFAVNRTDGSKVLYAYMTAYLENGERPFEIVTKAELDKIKTKAIAGKKGSPWEDWEPEMQKKTAIKRGAKLLPSSPEMQKAIQYDSLEEAGKLAITSGGDLINSETSNAVPEELEQRINAAQSREELNSILQSLPLADRKKITTLVQQRMRELG